MQPVIVSLSQSLTVVGRAVRTSHHDHKQAPVSPIRQLWSRYLCDDFPSQIARGGERVYGVYHEFENGWDGAYTVVAGMDNVPAYDSETQVKLEPGRYLVFSCKGEKEAASVACWDAAWNYFQQEDCPYTRRFATDFEQYLSDNTVELYISVE